MKLAEEVKKANSLWWDIYDDFQMSDLGLSITLKTPITVFTLSSLNVNRNPKSDL